MLDHNGEAYRNYARINAMSHASTELCLYLKLKLSSHEAGFNYQQWRGQTFQSGGSGEHVECEPVGGLGGMAS